MELTWPEVTCNFKIVLSKPMESINMNAYIKVANYEKYFNIPYFLLFACVFHLTATQRGPNKNRRFSAAGPCIPVIALHSGLTT